MKIVYGPVSSWRLGCSLGIDPICREPKVCSLNCIYCQLGARGILTMKRSKFIRTSDLMEELDLVKPDGIEMVTFSGTGETMLASNIKEMAEATKKRIDLPLAIMTNSCHFLENGDLKDLEPFDIVIARLDAATETTFRRVNRPPRSNSLAEMVEGIRRARAAFGGSFRLQLMFLEENANEAAEVADLCREIDPDLVYINTPLRPCTCRPLPKETIDQIVPFFNGLRVESVYG